MNEAHDLAHVLLREAQPAERIWIASVCAEAGPIGRETAASRELDHEAAQPSSDAAVREWHDSETWLKITAQITLLETRTWSPKVIDSDTAACKTGHETSTAV